jgi:hypothetical protein
MWIKRRRRPLVSAAAMRSDLAVRPRKTDRDSDVADTNRARDPCKLFHPAGIQESCPQCPMPRRRL